MRINEFTVSQIAELKQSTEYLLENMGLRVQHKGVLKLAAKAGAKVEGDIVRLPAALQRELLALAPSSYAICALDGSRYDIGAGKQYCHAIVTDPWIVDYETRSPRRPCLEDLRRHTIIAQKLEDVVAVSRMDFPVKEYDDATSSLRAMEMHLLNFAKHYFIYAASFESFSQWLELGAILAPGGRLAGSGLMSVAVAVASPLTINAVNAELLMGAAANGFAVIPTICPMAGTTSPYGKDATLLLGNAENIFLAALTQLVRPGNPFLYTFGPSRSNMRSGYDMYYTLDKVMWKIAAVELAKSYGLPSSAECGGSMTYRYDQQSGAEGMLFMLVGLTSGADFLCGIGSCHNAVGMSAEMMLIQSEWLKAAKFLSRGLPAGRMQKSIESIMRAGHGGNFLTDDMTIEQLRSGEFFSPDLLDYSGESGISPSLLEKAHARVEEMVAGYRSPVPERTQNQIRDYFKGLYGRIGTESA